MIKLCERCGVKFECKADDISNCNCFSIELSHLVQAELKEKYHDCLCADCLKRIEYVAEFRAITI